MTKTKASAAAASRPSRGDRMAARLSLFGKAPKAVVTSPEPLWTGDAASARRLASGLFLFGGAIVEAKPGDSPWDQSPPTMAWEEALHGFDWLDHQPVRVNTRDVPTPYAKNLEAAYLPNADRIVEAVSGLFA